MTSVILCSFFKKICSVIFLVVSLTFCTIFGFTPSHQAWVLDNFWFVYFSITYSHNRLVAPSRVSVTSSLLCSLSASLVRAPVALTWITVRSPERLPFTISQLSNLCIGVALLYKVQQQSYHSLAQSPSMSSSFQINQLWVCHCGIQGSPKCCSSLFLWHYFQPLLCKYNICWLYAMTVHLYFHLILQKPSDQVLALPNYRRIK